MPRFRFRPRFRGLAATAIGVGAASLAGAIWAGGGAFLIACGGIGVALGVLYLVSPTWRITVTVDDDALEVGSPKQRRFRVPWSEIVKVVASPSTRTCFVDGGDPARSLLVPGDGAPAPYAIENRDALYAAILAHVPPDRVVEVELLERYQP
jgi:hypothetical protein